MIDSVPLIQNPNDAQQINASIIAMKKASRELDEKIVKLNSLNSELDKKIAFLDFGLNKEIEDRKEAINSLDVSSVGGDGKYISAISETDGVISATATDLGNMVPVNSVTSGNMHSVTSGAVYTELRGLKSFYVMYGTPKSITLSIWGSWLVIGNIDGSGNFGFLMTIANSGLYVQNLVTGAMAGYFLASVTNNKITVGNGTHNLEITISGSTLTFTKTTSAGVHITIIGAGANIT